MLLIYLFQVNMELKLIIVKLIQHYPQQCLWMIISVVKSSYAVRSKRCNEILNDSNLKTNTMTRLIKDFTSMAERLIELCNKEISPEANSAKVSVLIRSLPRYHLIVGKYIAMTFSVFLDYCRRRISAK